MLVVDPVGFKNGLKEGQFDLYPWPISDDEHKQKFAGVLDLVIDRSRTEDPAISDLLLSDTRYILMLLNLIHINAATNLSKRKWGGVQPNFSIESFQNTQQKEIEFGGLESNRWTGLKKLGQAVYLSGKHSRIFHGPGSGIALKAWSRSLVLSVQHIWGGKNYKANHSGSSHQIGLGNPGSHLRKKYLEGRNINLIWVENLIHLNARKSIGCEELPREILVLVNQVFDKIRQMPDLYIENIDLKYLEEGWKNRLTIMWKLYWAYRSEVWRKVDTLHLVGAGNTARRLLALAWQREGVKIVAYNHGGNLHLTPQRYYFLMQEAIWGNLVCPNETIARNMRSTYSELSLEPNFNKPVYLFPENSDEKGGLIRADVSIESSEKAKKLLLVGFPMHAKRYFDGSGSFFYFRLDLELRLALQLKNLGYEVHYKVHPDLSRTVDNIFSSNKICIVGGAFEEVCLEYDKFIFTNTQNTPFSFALTTNKPILLTLHNNGNFSQDALETIEKRVDIVPIMWSNSNRLIYDDQVLVDAVRSEGKKEQNTEFWEKYIRHQWHYTRYSN